MWTAPGPYRWVFAYDVATDTWDETFPQLVVPDPATGRRNFALVYVPIGAASGIGTGIPGMWAFGGYDGSGTNAQTDTSEFYSYLPEPIALIPDAAAVVGLPGTTVDDNFILQNNTENSDSFNLGVTSDVTWTYSIPVSVGPVGADGGEAPFPFSVDIPGDVSCPTTGVFTVTATSVLSPTLSGVQAVSVRAACGISGVVLDANTSAPIENAYVWVQTDPKGLTGDYYDGYTNASGQYVLTDVNPGTYYMAVDAQNFQPSFYPAGWPDGATMVTIPVTGAQDFQLVASEMGWLPADLTYTFASGSQDTGTLTITNTGTGPLNFVISLVDSGEALPPAGALAIPELPRIDPQIAQDIATNGSADFVVVLKGQADVSAASGIQDWNARGAYVYKTLSDYAVRGQVSLRHFLTASRADYTPLFIINAVIVRGGSMDLVNNLATRRDVAQIIANRKIAVEEASWVDKLLSAPEIPSTVGWNISQVNANDVWALGYNGAGTVVAEIDTGTQWDHPALKGHYRGWNGSTADHNYNWFDPYAQCPSGGTVPCDGAQHGTHVMGTMIGDDAAHTNQIGMAPGAKWISCKGGDAVSGYLLTNELLQCAQWILAPTDLNGNNPDPSKRPNVVNNSWGGGPNDYFFAGAVSAWRASGIFPSFATGNSGPECSSAHSPGDNSVSYGTGATDNTDTIASFSGRGPAYLTGILKPQIVAPGVNIRSSIPGNTYAGGWNGTSMATPHTSGAVALLWSAAPELVGQIDLTGWLLEQTALHITTSEGCGGDLPTDVPNNTYGWGRLDILAAVNAALAGGVTPDWITADPVGGVVMPGDSLDVTLSFDVPVVPGVYTATLWLVAYDPYNPDVRLPIEVTAVGVPPTAEFTSNSPVLDGFPGLFTSTSTGSSPMTFLWNFGDGITSTLEAPSHVYPTADVYTVTLTATNDFGSDAVTHNFTVNGVPPEGEFHSPAPIMLGDPITFTVVITGTGPFEYLWDFGDGVTSTLATPSHLYETAGTFTVTVTVTSEWGTVTLTDQFEVLAPEFQFIYLPLVAKTP
jgi:subtilisin family serine protease